MPLRTNMFQVFRFVFDPFRPSTNILSDFEFRGGRRCQTASG